VSRVSGIITGSSCYLNSWPCQCGFLKTFPSARSFESLQQQLTELSKAFMTIMPEIISYMCLSDFDLLEDIDIYLVEKIKNLLQLIDSKKPFNNRQKDINRLRASVFFSTFLMKILAPSAVCSTNYDILIFYSLSTEAAKSFLVLRLF
jgi:hypothetical protein